MHSTRIGGGILHEASNVSGQSVSIGATDVARGLITYENDPAALQGWATVLLVIDAIDVGPFQDDMDFDLLWGAVWDASFGSAISDRVFERASTLVQNSGGAGPKRADH